MKRRRLLAVGGALLGSTAGCSSPSGDRESATPTEHSPTATATTTPTEEPTATRTARENPNTIFVERGNYGDGRRDNPVESIQRALDTVEPGETIHVLPGTYTDSVETIDGGTAEEPITITGPPDAVFNANGPFEINHSHVHLVGLAFDGLHTPSEPEDAESYSESILQVNESLYEEIKNGRYGREEVPDEEYVTDVVVQPHAVGNCNADFIKVHWSRNIDVGGFRVTGPAGAKYLYGDGDGHNSEFVYVGNPPGKGYPPDRTRNVRIHHIDNSAGHPHAEMVDCKPGTSNVTVEYCTDAGGANAAVTDDTQGGALTVGGTDITVRWNSITNGAKAGIEIDSDVAADDNPPAVYAESGSNNAIYGNRLLDNGGLAIAMPYADEGQGQSDQRTICGNEYNGETHGDPDGECPDWVPSGGGVGHTGGDPPRSSRRRRRFSP